MVPKKLISAEAAARSAARSTRASAKLEGRVVASDNRTAPTLRYVAKHPPRTR